MANKKEKKQKICLKINQTSQENKQLFKSKWKQTTGKFVLLLLAIELYPTYFYFSSFRKTIGKVLVVLALVAITADAASLVSSRNSGGKNDSSTKSAPAVLAHSKQVEHVPSRRRPLCDRLLSLRHGPVSSRAMPIWCGPVSVGHLPIWRRPVLINYWNMLASPLYVCFFLSFSIICAVHYLIVNLLFIRLVIFTYIRNKYVRHAMHECLKMIYTSACFISV
jgi:hypothetical protein